eukprot:11721012-Alexandrium_andersonii.AAC.1
MRIPQAGAIYFRVCRGAWGRAAGGPGRAGRAVANRAQHNFRLQGLSQPQGRHCRSHAGPSLWN